MPEGSVDSWNHSKIVAVNGKELFVGGHNLWHDDYLGFAPIHDVMLRLLRLWRPQRGSTRR